MVRLKERFIFPRVVAHPAGGGGDAGVMAGGGSDFSADQSGAVRGLGTRLHRSFRILAYLMARYDGGSEWGLDCQGGAGQEGLEYHASCNGWAGLMGVSGVQLE